MSRQNFLQSRFETRHSIESDNPIVQALSTVVDVGLIGIPMAAPWFMGGRHPLGELVIVLLAVVVSLAWLVARMLSSRPTTWTYCSAQWLLAAAVTFVLLQLTCLPM